MNFGLGLLIFTLCWGAFYFFMFMLENHRVLEQDYPKYAGYFSSRKFRRSFIKKIQLEEKIDFYKNQLKCVDADVEFYINYIEKQGGNK